MKFCVIIAILALSTYVTASAQEIGGSCPDLSITGIHSKDELSKFLIALKSAAKAKDFTVLSKSVLFPLQVNVKPKRKPIKNEDELKKDFSFVFSLKILSAIDAQKFEDLFCRDQGAMVGDGEIWINERNGHIGIGTINL